MIHNILHLSLRKKKEHISLSNFLFIFSNYPEALTKHILSLLIKVTHDQL